MAHLVLFLTAGNGQTQIAEILKIDPCASELTLVHQDSVRMLKFLQCCALESVFENGLVNSLSAEASINVR